MEELTQLSPDQYGLKPTDTEFYIALSVKHYLISLSPEGRKQFLHSLLKPKAEQDGKTPEGADRQVLGLLAEYATHETSKTFESGTAEAPASVFLDADTTSRIKDALTGVLHKSYQTFRPEDMSKKLETFLSAVWKAAQA
ncbi:MAG: hypothetical protein IJ229_01675 [Clostridia bacterium]|nr:hypothetical protein [Clostridia bacterium]